ncbi:MAG: aminotransferase class V-fold PLP-dependent enzyme [Christensenellaceae bacterium]|jgi:cysteine desulfurase|nr:aminotransferase class V-fold PLP-dependent enzyme [Christensenellaceae bacterium]
MIYLDYAADTPVDPAVIAKFAEITSLHYANPNSKHVAGLASRAAILDSLARMRSLLMCGEGYELIPTSSASESNNLALSGIVDAYSAKGSHIIGSPLEHTSVGACLTALKDKGKTVDLLRIKKDGTVDLDHLRTLLRPDTVLLTVCAVDPELGTIQPLSEIVNILKDFPTCRFHTDATQAIGKIKVDIAGIHCLTFAAHKIYGYNGAGFLLREKNTILTPIIRGGSSISIYRSGTPSASLIISSALALELAISRMESNNAHIRALNEIIKQRLSSYKDVHIFSTTGCVPHIINVGVANINGEVFCDALSDELVCVSSKSACTPRGNPSKAVYALTSDRKLALSSWRISIGAVTSEREIVAFLDAFDACYNRLVKN